MTEIATYEPQSAPVVTFMGAANIEATARALVDAHKIGTALCRTAFVPKHFQGKPDDAAAAILYGSTINMDPVTALQNIYVIGGKPALYARTMAAIVMSHGHQMWTEEESEGRVTVAGKRKGSENVERVTWTTEMAARAGYTSNAKYKSDPRSMLYARASGDVARRIAPDALLGMAHNVEELTISGEFDRPASTANAPTSAPDRMRGILGTQPEPTPQPEADPETGEVIEAEIVEPSDPIQPKQLSKLQILLKEVGLTERDEALAYYARVTGREVDSSKALSRNEAGQVLDDLERVKAGEPNLLDPASANDPSLPLDES